MFRIATRDNTHPWSTITSCTKPPVPTRLTWIRWRFRLSRWSPGKAWVTTRPPWLGTLWSKPSRNLQLSPLSVMIVLVNVTLRTSLVSDVTMTTRPAELNKAFQLTIFISTSWASYDSLVGMNTARLWLSCVTFSVSTGLHSPPSQTLERRWGSQRVLEVPFYHEPHRKYSTENIRKYSGHKVRKLS